MSATSQVITAHATQATLVISRWVIPFIFWFVLITNLAATSYIAVVHLEPFADLATYYQEGQMLAQGKGFTQPIKINVRTAATEAPFPTSDRFVYPMLVAVAIKLFGDSLSVANLVAAFSMALTAIPLYALGKQLFDERTALLATLFFALNPLFHVIGVAAWTDSTANLVYYVALWCIAAYHFTPSTRSALLAGALVALAALTREESILLVLALAAVWWWRGRERTHGLMFALGPLVALALRALYLQQTFGNPFYTERSYFWLPRWPLWYYLGTFTPQEYLDYVGGIGGLLSIRLFNLLRFVVDHFSDGLFYFTDLGLMPLTLLVALVVGWRAPSRAEQRALLKLFAGIMLLQMIGRLGYPGWVIDKTARHGMFATPFMFLLAAAGLLALWQRARWGRVLALALTLHYALFAVTYLGVWGQALIRPAYRGPIVLAAEWARAQLPASAVLMTRRAAETHYFSGKPVVVTPSAPFADLMAFARAHHITHFVLSDDDRNGAPNLLQGIRAFPQNFQTAYASQGIQIVAVTSYDFPPPLALPNELYASETTGRPAQLVDWNRLRPVDSGVLFQDFVSAWADLSNAVLRPFTPSVPRQASVNVRAGDHIELVRYELANSALQRGDELQLALHWRARAHEAELHGVRPLARREWCLARAERCAAAGWRSSDQRVGRGRMG